MKTSNMPLMGLVVLTSGNDRAGYCGEGGKQALPLTDGRVLICSAQRGECRDNHRHYDRYSGIEASISWTLPQVTPQCPRTCPYRKQECHPEDPGSCKAEQDLPVGYYKTPVDFCPHRHQDSSTDRNNCPVCSQPLYPSDFWVDLPEVQLWKDGHMLMHMMFRGEEDLEKPEHMTRATWEAITAKVPSSAP